MRTKRSGFMLLAICVALVLVVAPLAQANHCDKTPIGQFCQHRHGPDPCAERDRGPLDDLLGLPGGGTTHPQETDPLCLPGPASCVAVAVAVEIASILGGPPGGTPGVNVQLSRSVAQAQSYYFGFGSSHADAHQARATAGSVASVGAIESECNALSTGNDFGGSNNHADGKADIAQFKIDLNPYSIPLVIEGDVLCEHGSSTNGVADPAPAATCTPGGDTGPTALGMGNRADIANLLINGFPVIPPSLSSVPPNTVIPLGIADVFLNEQGVSVFYGCPTYWGDALRVVVLGGLATVTISHVATTTCGDIGA